MFSRVLIVGASVAGLGVANELRRLGFPGSIMLADGQPHLPYDRPPLSKSALATDDAPPHFHDADHYTAKDITLKLGVPASALNPTMHTVTFADGSHEVADAIVIATGARAKRLPAALAPGDVHVVRDLDDAIRLRAQLVAGHRLAMIGAGFIGAEVASTAAKLGLQVTLVDAAALPMAPILGDLVAERVLQRHRDAGLSLELGSPLHRILDEDGGHVLELANGKRIVADIVVAGLGSIPNNHWLEGSGVDLGDGVLCDERGQTSRAGIFAAGDVAAWRDRPNGDHSRHEHWAAAREQGRIVAQLLAGQPEGLWRDFIPYFWSDIHGKRLQILGETAGASQIEFVLDDAEKGSFVAEFREEGELVGVAGMNAGARVMRYMAQLQNDDPTSP